jgi:HAD superfamily hydrolase (TIGR01509 family)
MNKAVLFDLDGVLVDACDWHYESLNLALGEVCGYEITREDHLKTFNGLPTLVKLSILKDRRILKDEDIDRVSSLKQEYTTDVIKSLCEVDESKVELITHLKENGYKVACVTNSIRKTAKLMLERLGVLHLLDLLISNEDSQYNKPHPEGYIKSLILLNSLPEDSIIVEDSPKGLEAARLTGCKVIQVKDAKEVTLENIVV